MDRGAVGERIEVEGVVQGVGFRPFVYRLATALGLSGFVGNDSSRVFIEVAGGSTAVDEFVFRLKAEAPSSSRVDRITRRPARLRVGGFRIVKSRAVEGRRTLVPPDTALCEDCRRELFDPNDRRFRHAFISCTNCGPRFTIITAMPYDRPNTTMSRFIMCLTCADEYHDPGDRRYHAQPIACQDCGPVLCYREGASTITTGPESIATAQGALAAGKIVAIKGLGGYHLACDATNYEAVAALRARKRRAEKPFAVMVGTVGDVGNIGHASARETALLRSAAAPIVLLQARQASPVSDLVSAGNPLIGVMLAYTPIHHLLMAGEVKPLVMTSANWPGEPIANEVDSLDEWAPMADGVVDHDRPIHIPCDDSVVRLAGDRILPMRRGRGFAPVPVPIPLARRAVLAVGSDIKSAFCVAADGQAWVSQHVGDMQNLSTQIAFGSLVAQFATMYDVEVKDVAADAHPSYHSSAWAERSYPGQVRAVQHHHAHVASVMAEHGLHPRTEVLGFAFDGTGYGADGAAWGGEVMVASALGFERVAHLVEVPIPGGDSAVRHPARVALAHLHAAGLEWHPELPPVAALDAGFRASLRHQLVHRTGCVPTTSMGRLFDAVASLLGLRHEISYEAQAAIELESSAQLAPDQTPKYRFGLAGSSIEVAPVLASIVADQLAGMERALIAWRFHDAVADLVQSLASRFRDRRGLDKVVLAGGVFQNALLTTMCVDRLVGQGFEALTHSIVPPNDGGLALGQAYIASHREEI